MSDRLSLWDLYQKTQDLGSQMTTHTHPVSMITGLDQSALTGDAKTVNGHTVLTNVPAGAVFTDTVYSHPSSHPASMITGLHGCATTGYADYTYNLGTYDANGNAHGTGFPLKCQYNKAGDGRFKLYMPSGHGTSVDYSYNTGTAAVAQSVSCTNYGVPIEAGQYLDFHAVGSAVDYSVRLTGTSGALACTGTFTATKVYNAVWNDYAEWFERKDLEEKLEAGDILAWDGKGVTKADKDHQNVIGVFSDTYGHIVGGEQMTDMENNIKKFVPVGLAGRIAVKVKGKVNPGDFIIASDVPGIGIAGPFTPGKMIGKALDSYDNENVGRITALIVTI